MMDPHLSEAAVEALAHGRADLAPSEAEAHLTCCAQCCARVEETRMLSVELAMPMRELLGTDFDLSSIVDAAMLAAEAPESTPSHVAEIQSVRAPEKAPLVAGIVAGLLVAAVPSIVFRPELPSVGFALDIMRISRHVFSAIDSAVVSNLPGGWGLVMSVAWLGLFALGASIWPVARRLMPRASSYALMSCLAFAALFTPSAQALDIEGELPEKKVNLDVVQVPTSEALRRIAQSAGLDLVVTLPDDPKVTVRVRQAPVAVVLEAVIGDAPVRVKREGNLLIVRADGGAPAQPPAEPSAPAELPAPPQEPTAPGAPIIAGVPTPAAPPAPPAPPGRVRTGRAKDRVTFGSNVTVQKGEVVKDLVTMGGRATVYGVVEGDVVVMGGSADIKDGAEVFGELVALGGTIETAPGAVLHNGSVVNMGGSGAIIAGKHGKPGNIDIDVDIDEEDGAETDDADDADADDADDDATGGVVSARGDTHSGDHDEGDHDDGDHEDEDSWLESTLSSFSRHALLFVLGLVLLGAFPARLNAVTRVIEGAPLRSGAIGVLGLVGGVVLCIVLTITLIGLPAAFVLALALALALYAGVAATAAVVGKYLPLGFLRGHPIRELAAGVLVLFVVSLVPFFSKLVLAVACMVGLGAIVQTRFAAKPPEPPPPEEPPPVMPDLSQPGTDML